MSKSLGNFITIHELLETDRFGGRKWHGRVVRLAMLGTHYRQPIDWTVERLTQARSTLLDIAGMLHGVAAEGEPNVEVVEALCDDLNTPSALSIVYGLIKSAKRNPENAGALKATLQFMGVYGDESAADLDVGNVAREVDAGEIDRAIAARLAARKAKDFKESDRIRDELAAMGIQLKDSKNPATGEIETTWEVKR